MSSETYAKCPSIRSREVDDETVIIDKYTGEIHQLNPTASYIWDALDGTASIERSLSTMQKILTLMKNKLLVI